MCPARWSRSDRLTQELAVAKGFGLRSKSGRSRRRLERRAGTVNCIRKRPRTWVRTAERRMLTERRPHCPVHSEHTWGEGQQGPEGNGVGENCRSDGSLHSTSNSIFQSVLNKQQWCRVFRGKGHGGQGDGRRRETSHCNCFYALWFLVLCLYYYLIKI